MHYLSNNGYYGSLYNHEKEEKLNIKDMPLVKRGKDMNVLLFDLLTNSYSHASTQNESIVRNILSNHIRKYTDDIMVDKKGNLIVHVGDYKASKVMFSSHMDTVHDNDQTLINLHISDDKYVKASFDDVDIGFVGKGDKEYSEKELSSMSAKDFNANKVRVVQKTVMSPTVLGADDKLGCYIMCKLIENGIDGLYVFHVGEECGGIGSTYISEETPEIVAGMNYCIAFDRYGYNDVITRQSGGTCCSDEFAEAFCEQMNAFLPPKEQMKPSTFGSFTDSANYTGLIQECTNIAVGYKSQHTRDEQFDLEWLEVHLIPSLLKMEWDKLPCVRKKQSRVTYGRNYRSNLYSMGDDKFTRSTRTVRTPRNKYQSLIDKANNVVKKLTFDPTEGFQEKESEQQKRDRVKYHMINEDMSFNDIAELVVDTYDAGYDKGIEDCTGQSVEEDSEVSLYNRGFDF